MDVFEWDAANTAHIAKHGLVHQDVEQALADPELEPAVAYHTETEERFAYLGRTEDGRLLMIVLTLREGSLRVVTAHQANRRQLRAWRARHPT
jgi:uncharacterized protein